MTCMTFSSSIFSVVHSPGGTSEMPGILPGPRPTQLHQFWGVDKGADFDSRKCPGIHLEEPEADLEPGEN